MNLWHVQTCMNPNKSWIVDSLNNKITKLISTKTARLVVENHNREVNYYLNKSQQIKESLQTFMTVEKQLRETGFKAECNKANHALHGWKILDIKNVSCGSDKDTHGFSIDDYLAKGWTIHGRQKHNYIDIIYVGDK